MKPRKPLRRRTALSPGAKARLRITQAPITRRTGLAQKSAKKRADDAVWQRARRKVYARCAGRCEVCGVALDPADWECHHRLRRSQGGGHQTWNLLACCPGPSGCHRGRIHKAITEAQRNGWLVKSGQDPADVPVLIVGKGRQLLTEDCGYRAVAA